MKEIVFNVNYTSQLPLNFINNTSLSITAFYWKAGFSHPESMNNMENVELCSMEDIQQQLYQFPTFYRVLSIYRYNTSIYWLCYVTQNAYYSGSEYKIPTDSQTQFNICITL